jgi:hypothetical protein
MSTAVATISRSPERMEAVIYQLKDGKEAGYSPPGNLLIPELLLAAAQQSTLIALEKSSNAAGDGGWRVKVCDEPTTVSS